MMGLQRASSRSKQRRGYVSVPCWTPWARHPWAAALDGMCSPLNVKSELWLLVVVLTSFRVGCRICLDHYFASIGIVRMHEFPVI